MTWLAAEPARLAESVEPARKAASPAMGPLERGPLERDPYGLRRIYYRDDGRVAPRVADLLESPVRPDGLAVGALLAGQVFPGRSCAKGIRSVPPGQRLKATSFGGWRAWSVPRLDPPASPTSAAHLERALDRALRRARSGGGVALALSGGLDSALLLHLCRRQGLGGLLVTTLASGLAGYCELEDTERVADAMGCDLHIVRVTAKDFVDALPAAVRAAEVPFYNLHLVAFLLLARALRAQGIRTLITGHGADQALAHAPASSTANFLPWIAALVESQGLRLCAPFVEAEVLAAIRRRGADPTKTRLRRDFGAELPAFLTGATKTPRLAPPLERLASPPDLEALWRREALESWRADLLPFLRSRAWQRPLSAKHRTLLVSLSLLAYAWQSTTARPGRHWGT
ncbi:MAG: asparagine synthetase B family protein [Acidobacteriota bacterium]